MESRDSVCHPRLTVLLQPAEGLNATPTAERQLNDSAVVAICVLDLSQTGICMAVNFPISSCLLALFGATCYVAVASKIVGMIHGNPDIARILFV